ncbi:MAG: hypothetical protein MUF81_07180 [Verrucomicrobia bacterium]|jgi:hypothetical protein|nr:hypothetical protein [Verrucomicrobiota bacterium]
MRALLLWSLSDPDDPLPDVGTMSAAMREHLILLGAIVFVLAVLTIGIMLLRRHKRQRSKRHKHSRHRRPFRRAAAGLAEFKQMIHKKPRRRHHEPWPRNPTLAETGGLPPVRSDDEPLQPPQPGPLPQ